MPGTMTTYVDGSTMWSYSLHHLLTPSSMVQFLQIIHVAITTHGEPEKSMIRQDPTWAWASFPSKAAGPAPVHTASALFVPASTSTPAWNTKMGTIPWFGLHQEHFEVQRRPDRGVVAFFLCRGGMLRGMSIGSVGIYFIISCAIHGRASTVIHHHWEYFAQFLIPGQSVRNRKQRSRVEKTSAYHVFRKLCME